MLGTEGRERGGGLGRFSQWVGNFSVQAFRDRRTVSEIEERVSIASTPEELRGAISWLESKKPELPPLVALLERHEGFCFQRLGEPIDALTHFGAAVEAHPLKDEQSDYPAYVADYAEALESIADLTKNKQRQGILVETGQSIADLLKTVPSVDYKIYKALAICCDALEDPSTALSCAEKALLEHPIPTPDSDYPDYQEIYLGKVRKVKIINMPRLTFRKKQQANAADEIAEVLDSIERVFIADRAMESLRPHYQEMLKRVGRETPVGIISAWS